MKITKEYIAHDTGRGVWDYEPYNPEIEWHSHEFRGTKSECQKECYRREYSRPHYPNAPHESIWDY